MFRTFKYGPEDALPIFNQEGRQEFLNSPGSIIDIPPADHKTIYPTAIKNLAIVPMSALNEISLESLETRADKGYVIEHLATGYCYFVYLQMTKTKQYNSRHALMAEPLIEEWYSHQPIIDFKGAKDNPYEIDLFSEPHERWLPVSLDYPGTRMGGIPLKSDGSQYDGPWPHFKGEPLPFAGQHLLPDGRYVHIFFDDKDETSSFYNESKGRNCVIREGGKVPSWIKMKKIKEPLLMHADKALALSASNPEFRVAPRWLQGDYTPNSGKFDFIMQIEGDMVRTEDDPDFDWWLNGEFYVFLDHKTGEGLMFGQCD